MTPRTWADARERFVVVNTSGEAIPPFACMQIDLAYESGISGTVVDNYETRCAVKKPDADGAANQSLILVNGNIEIPIDGTGSAVLNRVALALWDDADGIPAPGEDVGPKAGSWYFSAKGKGWAIKTYDSGNAKYIDAGTRTVFVEANANLLETLLVTDNTPDGDGNYTATLQRYDPIGFAWASLFGCVVRAINGESLTSGTRYNGRFVGRITAGTPLYVTAVGGTGAQNYLFTLDADMSGSSQTATIKTMDDATTIGTSIAVVNTLGHFSHLLSGDRGVCVLVNGVYYAIHPEATSYTGDGSIIYATFTATGSTAATVIATNDAGLSPSDPITLTNTGDFEILSGAVGYAIKSGTAWHVIHVDQRAILQLVTTTNASHDISVGYSVNGDVAHQQTVTYSARVALTNYPFSFVGEGAVTITNPANMTWASGDKLLVTYNYNTAAFEVLSVRRTTSRRIRFKLSSSVTSASHPNCTGTAIAPDGTHDTGDMPSGSLTLKDDYFLAYNAKTGDKGEAEWDYITGYWRIVSITRIATEVKGTLAADFSGTPATFSVTVVDGYNGASPTGPLTVQNRYGWDAGTSGNKIDVRWDGTADEWYPIQMECPT